MKWAPIPGFDGYEASTEGHIRNVRTMRSMLGAVSPTGYRTVKLHVAGRFRSYRVHSLILLAFVGPRPTGQQTRHLNGIRGDNRLVNLAWGTAQENHADQVRHGTAYSHYKGKQFDDHPNGKIGPHVGAVLVHLAKHFGQKAIADVAGLHQSTISNIKKRLNANQRAERKMVRQAT